MNPILISSAVEAGKNSKGGFSGIIKEINKPVIIIIVAVIIAVVVFLIVKKIRKASSERENRDYLTGVKGNIDPNETSFSGPEYRDMAEKLFDAFNGPGTKNDVWKSVFGRMRTNSDVNQLIAAFGFRKATLLGREYGEAMSLSEWIEDELSSSQINYLNSMLASKRITITF